LALPHEGCLVGKLVGIGTGLGGEDLIQALRGYGQDTSLEDICPVVLGEVAESGAINDGRCHFRRGSCEEQRRVVVAHGDGCNLCINIKKYISIKIRNVVSIAAGVVGHHVQAASVKHLAQPLNFLCALWSRYRRLHNWLSGLVGEEGLLSAVCHSGCCGRSILSLTGN